MCQKAIKKLYGLVCWESPKLCDCSKQVFETICKKFDDVEKKLASHYLFEMARDLLGAVNVGERICIADEDPFEIVKKLHEKGAIETAIVKIDNLEEVILESLSITYWKNMIMTRHEGTLYIVLFNDEDMELEYTCLRMHEDPRVSIVLALALLERK